MRTSLPETYGFTTLADNQVFRPVMHFFSESFDVCSSSVV